MKEAPIPSDDSARISTLNHYKILDTPSEREFDAITQIASILCQTPITLISLVDGKRQWFKSRIGLSVSETPRNISFCGHAVAEKKTLIVKDALTDDRFKDNPLVLGPPNVRFYAGAPLVTSSGYALGTLCVIDSSPRDISEEQVRALELLAKQTVDQMELRRLYGISAEAVSQASKRGAELQMVNDRLTCLISHLRCGLLAQDSAGNVVYLNKSFLDLFGLDEKQTNGAMREASEVHRLLAPLFGSSDEYLQNVQQLVEEQSQTSAEDLPLKDGRIMRRDSIPVISQGVYSGHLWTFEDVTLEMKIQSDLDTQKARMAQTAKLSALGEMAGGIAHEINNPLAIIQGKAGLLQILATGGTLDKQAVMVNAEAISNVVTRISKIVRGLKTLSRDASSDSLCLGKLSQIVDDTLAFCGEHLKDKGIEVRVELESPDLAGVCRPAQVSEVLLNLISNAADAVQTANEKWIAVKVASVADNIEIRVADSGSGVPVALREKIFLPFITTKDPGKGTGLGLSVSRAIMESQKGKLFLDEQGKNTTFVMSIPAAC